MVNFIVDFKVEFLTQDNDGNTTKDLGGGCSLIYSVHGTTRTQSIDINKSLNVTQGFSRNNPTP